MKKLSRRAFLRSSLASSAAITSASALGINLALSRAVMAQSSARFNDTKALVCVFLFGGNDSFNLLVPTDNSDYAIYQGVRQNLAYAQDELLAMPGVSNQPYALGMPGAATSLHQLFESKKMSLVANIGPLAQPLTKSMIAKNDSLLPPQLFSHNDQQSLWQSASMNTSSTTGWAGRMADLIADTNDNLSMNLSIYGNNLMQSGTSIQPFSLSASGPENFAALNPAQDWNANRVAIFERLMDDVSTPLQRAYANKLLSAAGNNQRLLQAIETVEPTSVNYPNGSDLADQLKMVATLIASQEHLGQARQVYFVGMGGWDTHDAQSTVHPQLLSVLGDALLAFQQDLDQRELSQQVSTFTMSEFGRTLTSNGDGTDHGWAGHQLIMGGAVEGGSIFGHMPSLTLNSDDDLGDGRILPSLAVDQFGGALTKWFGLSDNEMNAVFPNLHRFDADYLSMFKS
jgi:uncharacterized protein (DUF1501 family)